MDDGVDERRDVGVAGTEGKGGRRRVRVCERSANSSSLSLLPRILHSELLLRLKPSLLAQGFTLPFSLAISACCSHRGTTRQGSGCNSIAQLSSKIIQQAWRTCSLRTPFWRSRVAMSSSVPYSRFVSGFHFNFSICASSVQGERQLVSMVQEVSCTFSPRYIKMEFAAWIQRVIRVVQSSQVHSTQLQSGCCKLSNGWRWSFHGE